MVKAAIQERRNFIRAKRVMSIQYRLLKSKIKTPTTKTWHLSATHDMSLGGVGFYSDVEYRVGDIIELQVIMSGLLHIYDGSAEVVRVEKKGSVYFVGVRILSKSTTKKAPTLRKTNRTVKRLK